MKSAAVLLSTLVAVGPALSMGHPTFEDWQRMYDVNYRTPEEVADRRKVFEQNRALVDQMNAEAGGYTDFELNQFADLSPDEFRAKFHLYPSDTPPLNPSVPVFDVPRKRAPVLTNYRVNPAAFDNAPSSRGLGGPGPGDLPDSFDWRTDAGGRDVVTAVRDQGSAGTCWAFSAVETIESAWALKTGNLTQLSVEQVVECDGLSDPPRAACGVMGGWPQLAYDYVIKAGGLMPETAKPYCCGGRTKDPLVPACYPCVPDSWNNTLCGPPPEYCNKNKTWCNAEPDQFVAKISSFVQVANNTDAVKTALVSQGPLSVCLNAAMLQFYRGGVWRPHLACRKGINQLDHCVQMVGYATVRGIPAFTIRNSWAKKWGMDGYFYIEAGNTCGIEQLVTYPVV